MVFLVRGGVQKTLKKRRKRTRKTLKNEEKEKRLWFYLLYKKLYFARNHSLEKVVYIDKFYLQFLCTAGYFKRSNDTPKLKWICLVFRLHRLQPEICISRLVTTK